MKNPVVPLPQHGIILFWIPAAGQDKNGEPTAGKLR